MRVLDPRRSLVCKTTSESPTGNLRTRPGDGVQQPPSVSHTDRPQPGREPIADAAVVFRPAAQPAGGVELQFFTRKPGFLNVGWRFLDGNRMEHRDEAGLPLCRLTCSVRLRPFVSAWHDPDVGRVKP